MQRVFKVIDDNNSGSLDIQEFWKAICDFRLKISQEECRALFDVFDRNGDGEISYEEFISTVAGELNARRRAVVTEAFRKLDRNGDGSVDVHDLQGVYSAKLHPEVRAGKRSEQDVLSEFLDTFEIHHAQAHPSQQQRRDASVDLDEFCEYYRNISASIEDDAHFELMINNAWKLDSKATAGTTRKFAR